MIGVLGTGTMGRGIALLAATNEQEVVVWGRSQSSLRALEEYVSAWIGRRLREGQLTEKIGGALIRRIKPTQDVTLLSASELIIEAVAEDLAVKGELFRLLDRLCSPTTVISSTTSSLLVSDIAKGTLHPERVIGMHFMNPPLVMPLVEVVPTKQTSQETIQRALSVCRTLKKEPLLSPDSPGFILNRTLFGMLREAMRLVESGSVSPESVDVALKLGARHPMGPLELADFIGLDICARIMENLARELNDDAYSPPRFLMEKVNRGDLGRKSGKGFHSYSR